MIWILPSEYNKEILTEFARKSPGFDLVSARFAGGRAFILTPESSTDGFDWSTLLPGSRPCLGECPYPMASRANAAVPTRIGSGPGSISEGSLTIMAGPCAVDSSAVAMATAETVRASGCRYFRGGLFKPRTSPYSFQGLGAEAGLPILAEIRSRFGLKIITEVMDPRQIEPLAAVVDIFQIGSRNMQNFELLRAMGSVGRPVLLKRGMAATVSEFLLSAEYILSHGNPEVILCERGIRTFVDHTRNMLDIGAIPFLKAETHLPVIVDPSHATGDATLVCPVALAALVAGADGLLVETHPDPAASLSDPEQALSPEAFRKLVRDIARLAEFLDKKVMIIPERE